MIPKPFNVLLRAMRQMTNDMRQISVENDNIGFYKNVWNWYEATWHCRLPPQCAAISPSLGMWVECRTHELEFSVHLEHLSRNNKMSMHKLKHNFQQKRFYSFVSLFFYNFSYITELLPWLGCKSLFLIKNRYNHRHLHIRYRRLCAKLHEIVSSFYEKWLHL